MKKILSVTPNWPPISCPDMQRIRMSAPFFEQFGWEPLILRINPDEQEGTKDLDLAKTIPVSIKSWQSGCLNKKLTSLIGLKSVGLRSFFHLANLGDKIISSEKPALVFFSTTMFPLMIIGRYWLWKYKIPYIIDFQDPWLSDYYELNKSKPHGGLQKYKIARTISKILEPFTLKKVSHIISVSPEYPKVLMQRYAWLTEDQFTVLPFGAPEKDFEILPKLNIQQKIFDPNDGCKHWVYVGRGGDDMTFSLNALFASIAKNRQQNLEPWEKIKIHFVGTKYSIFDNSKQIEELGKSYNLDNIVTEYPQRIPYFEALQVLKDSHAILIIGSDDSGYSASKVYPCILAQKPILAILHEQSLVVNVIKDCKVGQTVTFKNTTQNLQEQLNTSLEWLLLESENHISTTDWQAFQPYTAREMTRQQCAIFDRCLEI